MFLPPFHWNGFKLGLTLSVLYIIYDTYFGYTARESHPHNKFNYGMFGEKIYCPNSGTSFGYNWPILSKAGSVEGFGPKHSVPLSISSPFPADRVELLGGLPRDKAGH